MKKITLTETVLFALYGAMMYISAQIDIIPNVHPLALFISLFAVVYGIKGIIPVYVYVFLEGITGGFNLWWIPYTYIWAVLFFSVLLIPKKLNGKIKIILITVLCFLHGILFGVLYAPFECIVMFGGDIGATLSWIAAGVPFDVAQALGNGVSSLAVYHLSKLVCKLEKREPYISLT